jgi:hypothetical protein
VLDTVKTIVPFDFAASRSLGGWREDLRWPVRLGDLRKILADNQRVYTDFCANQSEPHRRDLAVLAGPRILSKIGALQDAALIVDGAGNQNLQMVGGPPELKYLASDWEQGHPPPATTAGYRLSIMPPRFRFARRFARTAMMSGWWRAPLAIVRPQAVAISHNALLMSAALNSPMHVGFDHGTAILMDARRNSPRQDSFPIGEFSREIRIALIRNIGLPEDINARLHNLAAPVIEAAVSESIRDLFALETVPLPRDIWAGTGAYHPTRAIALMVLRRGGTVTIFDHGGCSGFLEYCDFLGLNELAVASRFVLATAGVAHQAKRLGIPELIGWRQPEIAGGSGDPTFRPMRSLPPVPKRPRPRVVFASGTFYGFRQWYPPMIPDPVYHDWILRLVECVSRMPVDLLCKPHPEGLLKGQRHILADYAPTTGRRFEEVLPEADVLLYDDVHSTTFWESLCSNRRLVLIDLAQNRFNKELLSAFQRRCRIVPVHYDERNLPRVDPAELAAAVLGDADERIDPEPFLTLLAGAA